MLALMRWLAARRLRTLHAFGGWLGWLAYALSPRYRGRLKANAAQAGVTRAQRRAAVAEAGAMVAELPWLWLRPTARPLGALVRWQGAELIDAALGRSRGLLFLTPHLGCFEVTAQAFAERYAARAALTVMYRPARQAWLRELQRTARDRPGLATAPATLAGVRQMIRALRRGEAVGLLPDQVPPQGMGVWAPFFGRPAYTMTLAARLAQQTGAAMLLIWARRLPRGAGFEIRVSGAPQLPAATDDDAAQVESATAVNAAMEKLIRECPEQYLWGYNRYKTPRAMPAGDAGAATA
jgi:KDO2-lipid IV(A) lauroyltransferase